MIHHYNITGLHCEACRRNVQNALEALPSLNQVQTSLNPPVATFSMHQEISIEELNRELAKAGAYSLEEASPTATTTSPPADTGEERESPVILITILVALAAVAALIGYLTEDTTVHSLMLNYMGVFFIVFSLFKFVNLKGFATGFASYDIVARRSRSYALAYPFLEALLGILYLTRFNIELAHGITILIMGVGAVGVALALKEKRRIQCACLGTALKIPLSKVTLAEDLIMGLMAIWMLLA